MRRSVGELDVDLACCCAVLRHFQIPALGISVAFCLRMQDTRRFVYILKSVDSTPHFYVGSTSDVQARFANHNAGRCPHTARHRPWQLHVTVALPDEQRAIEFERYLKTGSWWALAKRHFG